MQNEEIDLRDRTKDFALRITSDVFDAAENGGSTSAWQASLAVREPLLALTIVKH